MKDGAWSEGLIREALWLSGKMSSYGDAAEVLERIGRLGMSQGSIWRRVEKWGAVCEQVLAQEQDQANCLPNRGTLIRGIEPKEERLGGSMDGAMVHIRDEGWKELKIGCVFEIEEEWLFDEDTQEMRPQARATDNTYVAHLGSPQPFGQMMWAEAQQRGWEQSYDTQIVADGASWIWNLTAEHFFDSHQTLDYAHACHYLHQASQLLYPHSDLQATRYLNQTETLLYQGQVEQIILDLRKRATSHPSSAKELRGIANYFETHKRRTHYLELAEEGYLLGSGMVESEAKQYKARFTGPGMLWSRQGLNHLLPFRTAIMSHSFNDLWAKAFNSPLN